MICDRPDCPIQFHANAMEEYRAKNMVPYSAQSETCEQCVRCNQLCCWERIVHWNKEKTEFTVELRRKSEKQSDAA